MVSVGADPRVCPFVIFRHRDAVLTPTDTIPTTCSPHFHHLLIPFPPLVYPISTTYRYHFHRLLIPFPPVESGWEGRKISIKHHKSEARISHGRTRTDTDRKRINSVLSHIKWVSPFLYSPVFTHRILMPRLPAYLLILPTYILYPIEPILLLWGLKSIPKGMISSLFAIISTLRGLISLPKGMISLPFTIISKLRGSISPLKRSKNNPSGG